MTTRIPRTLVCLPVQNGAAWLPEVLDALVAQTQPNLELIVWDNASEDATADIVRRYPTIRLTRSEGNIGPWAVFERVFGSSDAEYLVALTDVILAPAYIAESVNALEREPDLGAVQGKLYRMDTVAGAFRRTNIIDAAGFKIGRSRRLTILGHGQPDGERWDKPMDIIGVEGAAPVFRRAAWEDCRIHGTVLDPDFRVGSIGYGDDLDIAWRMSLFGWRQAFIPSAQGWHDRSTTKDTALSMASSLARRSIRQRIPLLKRRLVWSNVRFAMMKNERLWDVVRDFPRILIREAATQAYLCAFEPAVLKEWGRFLRLLPRMLRRRRAIQRRARKSSLKAFLT